MPFVTFERAASEAIGNIPTKLGLVFSVSSYKILTMAWFLVQRKIPPSRLISQKMLTNSEHRCCVTHETDEESTVPATKMTTSLVSTSTTSQEPLLSSPTTIDSVAELKSSTEPATITEEAVVPSDGLTPLDDPNINVSV